MQVGMNGRGEVDVDNGARVNAGSLFMGGNTAAEAAGRGRGAPGEYRPNPAHSRAKLVVPTESGRAAVSRIAPDHRRLAERLARELGIKEFQHTLEVLHRLSSALDSLDGD